MEVLARVFSAPSREIKARGLWQRRNPPLAPRGRSTTFPTAGVCTTGIGRVFSALHATARCWQRRGILCRRCPARIRPAIRHVRFAEVDAGDLRFPARRDRPVGRPAHNSDLPTTVSRGWNKKRGTEIPSPRFAVLCPGYLQARTRYIPPWPCAVASAVRFMERPGGHVDGIPPVDQPQPSNAPISPPT